MISVSSEIEGKKAVFGEIEEPFAQNGFVLGGSWEFEQGYFDAQLELDDGETIYLRIPADVIEGALDDPDAVLQFGKPFLLRHVVELGIQNGSDSFPLVDQLPAQANALVNQFGKPLETDGEIHNQAKRVDEAKKALTKLLPYVH